MLDKSKELRIKLYRTKTTIFSYFLWLQIYWKEHYKS